MSKGTTSLAQRAKRGKRQVQLLGHGRNGQVGPCDTAVGRARLSPACYAQDRLLLTCCDPKEVSEPSMA